VAQFRHIPKGVDDPLEALVSKLAWLWGKCFGRPSKPLGMKKSASQQPSAYACHSCSESLSPGVNIRIPNQLCSANCRILYFILKAR